MADKWQLIHPKHINAIVDGYEETIEHNSGSYPLSRRELAAIGATRRVLGLCPISPQCAPEQVRFE